MQITHIQNKPFDFSSATFEEKKDLVKILMEKQKSLAQTLLQTYPPDIDLQICLMFIRKTCDSKFGDYFARLIPSRIISEEEFTVFFAEKLDAFLLEQAAEVSQINLI